MVIEKPVVCCSPLPRTFAFRRRLRAEVEARSLDGRETGRRRAAGWARSGGASKFCAASRQFLGMVITVVMVYRCAEAVQQQACRVQRDIAPLLKNPKLLIYR
ncbi:MAG TPA: hypothetical protein VFX36_05040 [Nitrospira sp.]|nr:hypothetical protein [Nitrospira sp.]